MCDCNSENGAAVEAAIPDGGNEIAGDAIEELPIPINALESAVGLVDDIVAAEPQPNENDNESANASAVEPPEQVDLVEVANRKRKLHLPATEGGVLHFFGSGGLQYGWFSEDQLNFPRILESLKDQTIIAVACGSTHNIVLDENGMVWSFGNNADNALGRPTPDKPFAVDAGQVAIGKTVVQISAGGSHSAALTEDGEVYVWGCFKYKNGVYGLIPEDAANHQSRGNPTLITAHLGVQITKIASGEQHLVMLGADGNVYTCGTNEFGQLGRQAQKQMRVTRSMGRVSGKPIAEEVFLLRPTLMKLARGPKIENIWTGFFTTFCSKAGSEAIHFAVGLNDCLQCGIVNDLRDRTDVTYPFRKTHLRGRKWKQVVGGHSHTIGLTQAGQVYTFGSPLSGKLGIGEDITGAGVVDPTMIPELEDKICTLVAAGPETSYAVTELGHLYSWGSGKNLLLATGNHHDKVIPVRCLSGPNQPIQGRVLTIDAGEQGVLLTIALPEEKDAKSAKIGGDD